MPNITFFLVLAFSRTEEREFRVGAAIEAPSKQHAMSTATHLASAWRGTVAFSITGDPSTAEWDDAEILALFGDLPENHALYQELSRVWASERSQGTGGLARPLANEGPVHSLRWRLSSRIPFAPRQERRAPRGPKRSPVIAGLTAVGLAGSGSVMLILTAKAAQREARLMEMARPACIHIGVTNQELHHLVRHELQAGSSKSDAFRTVVTLCQAKAGML